MRNNYQYICIEDNILLKYESTKKKNLFYTLFSISYKITKKYIKKALKIKVKFNKTE